MPLIKYECHPAFFSQFQRELEILGTLDHPIVLRAIQVYTQASSRPYMVTELLEGQTLHALLLQLCPMENAQTVSILVRLCEAVAYIHDQGVVGWP
jgi:serine/threonine protein kinase